MKTNPTFVIAVLALTVAAASWLRPSNPPPASPSQPQSSLPPTPTASTPAPIPNAPPPAPVPATHDPALIEMLTGLQGRFDQLESRLEEMQTGWQNLARRGMVPLTQEYEQELRTSVLDTAGPWRDRLNAFRLLRRHGKVTDDLAMALIQVAQTSPDERARAEALGNLDGITNSVIQSALVQTLSSTGSDELRRRAADALSAFATDPNVEKWLRYAAENDQDPGVRKEAQQALNERFRSMDQDALEKLVTNASLPPAEQVAAMRRLSNDKKSAQVAGSMIDLYLNSEDSGLRAEILRGMDGSTDPAMKAPLLNWLASEPDANARGEAAENLKHYRDDPNVVQWLEYASEHDPSGTVRKAAAAALRGRDPR